MHFPVNMCLQYSTIIQRRYIYSAYQLIDLADDGIANVNDRICDRTFACVDIYEYRSW